MNLADLGLANTGLKGAAGLVNQPGFYLLWEVPNPGTAIKYKQPVGPDQPLSSGISLYGSVFPGSFPWGQEVEPDNPT